MKGPSRGATRITKVSIAKATVAEATVAEATVAEAMVAEAMVAEVMVAEATVAEAGEAATVLADIMAGRRLWLCCFAAPTLGVPTMLPP